VRVTTTETGAEAEAEVETAFTYDAVNQRVVLTLCFARAGIYRAAVSYDSTLLLNGEFDCIVLTGELIHGLERS
jgi:hypothetical protein